MGLFSLIKSCFCIESEPLADTHWKKATLLILVNQYELDYEIKDRNGKVLDDCPIEDYDEKKHDLTFAGENYYKRALSRV